MSSAFFQKLAFLLKAAQRENIKHNLKYTICTKIRAFNCSFIQILKIFAFPIYSFEKLCYNIQRKENIAKLNVVFVENGHSNGLIKSVHIIMYI